jgi:hypothetical protein
MKKILQYMLIVVVAVLTFSCEDTLNPYGSLDEKYILNCVIRGDSTFQVATLTKSYMATEGSPYTYTDDPAIKGATIRIWDGNDKVAFLKDTTISEPEGSDYNRPYSAYYTNQFQPKNNSTLEIEAILPNGKKLRSQAKVPAKITVYPSFSTDQLPPKEGNDVIVKWLSDQKNPTFIVRLAIYYFKYEDGQKKRNVITIPLSYVKYNNDFIPVYPKPQSELTYVLSMETVNKAMELISKGDENKSRYEILSCIAEVLSLNEELSFYYNGTARSSDTYSVKLDETDYSNIQNGSGLFGVYMRSYMVLRFKHDYIYSFGYVPGLTDVN